MATKLSTAPGGALSSLRNVEAMAPQVKLAHETLHAGTGLGSDFLGWIQLPTDYDKEEFSRIQKAAEKIKSDTDIFIVIGIGGFYLGARAAIEFFKIPNYNALKKDTPDIYFAGNSISSTALAELIDLCEGRDVSINMISNPAPPRSPLLRFVCSGNCWRKSTARKEPKEEFTAPPTRAQRHLEEAGRRGGLRNLCGSRRRGRTVFRTDGGRPASHRGGRLRYRRF